MKKHLHFIFFVCLTVFYSNVNAQATYTSIATGMWNAPATWTVSAGADVPADGIPDIDDNVSINLAHTVTVNVNSAVNNITLLGAAISLTVNTTITLQVNGTMNGPSLIFSNQIITTPGTGKVQFIGNSRALFGATWAASPHAWTAEIFLSSNAQTGTSSTNVKFGSLIVTQGIFRVGNVGSYQELRLSMDLSPVTFNGSMTIAAGARVITGRCGEKSNALNTACLAITINGTLEMHGGFLSGQTITVNNGGVLSVRKNGAGGLSSNPFGASNFVYNVGSTVEYVDDPAFLGRADMGLEINQSVGKNLYNVIADHTTGINVQYAYNQLSIFTLRRGNVISTTANVITYGTASTLAYNGTVAQNAANTGAVPSEIEFPIVNGPFNLTINNTTGSNVTLFNPRTIGGTLTLTNGRFFTTAVNLLTLASGAVTAGATNASFVHGALKKTGQTAFTFPVGKNNDLQLCGIGVGGAASATTFWTENFTNGCALNCLASSYSGPNGAWTIANGPGTNGNIANEWFISCAENGNAAGTCGTGCGNNATLHVGSVPCGLCFLFCPSGDCGASYNAGPTFSGENPATDKRTVSPTISTIGRSGITLGFKYIEDGQGFIDDAIVEYSTNNGGSWTTLINTPKTNNTGCGGQGRWTAYTIALPASCDNIATLKIAFRWYNPSDNTGSDPSFAVDDVTLAVTDFDAFTAEYFRANPRTTFNNIVNAPLDHISACEYWRIERNVGTVNRNVSLSWDNNSCGVTVLNELRVAYFNLASWSDQGTNAAAGSTSCAGTTCGTIPSNPIANFGVFTLSSTTANNPLPVSLLNFYGVKNKNTVDLFWNTASEINNNFFSLEKSSDKISYDLLTAIRGAGTTTQTNYYSFVDKNPFAGLNYYRLKQTDYNGDSQECGTIAVRFSADITAAANIYSDHNNSQIIISFDNEVSNAVIELYDIAGRKIKTLNEEKFTSVKIPILQNAGGIYFVRIYSDNGSAFKLISY